MSDKLFEVILFIILAAIGIVFTLQINGVRFPLN
jgi:hypothetical protein